LPSAIDNRPLQFSEIQERLPQTVYVSATPSAWELNQSTNHVIEQLIRPTGLLDPTIDIRPIGGQIPDLVKEIFKRFKKGQRTLVTTLTKRTAEALTEYLNDDTKVKQSIPLEFKSLSPEQLGPLPKVQYLHADVLTLDRQDILDSLRSGEFDVVVGINLLREGLDLPEVSLVAILDADKEGFLRSKTSLIQTMGRAARHLEGKVIMYADKITPSMQSAIDEVTRRRQIQRTYNKEHGITPISIQKPIREKLLDREPKEISTKLNLPKSLQSTGWHDLEDINPDGLTPKDKLALKKHLKKCMTQAAKDWNFELAARYRDTQNRL
jgi:excinuclease ABC subunit B